MATARHLLIFKVGVKCQGHMLVIVVKPCKHNTDWTVSARIKLGTHTTYNKRTTPIHFKVRGQRSSHTLVIFVKPSQRDTEGTVLARTINLRGQEDDTYWFSRSRVKGHGHTLDVIKPCKHDADWTVQLGPSNSVHILVQMYKMARGRHQLIIEVRGQRSGSQAYM